MTASSYRVQHLHRLEFSLSDNEGKRLELFTAFGQRPELVDSRPSSWVEFIGNNVDHQVRTLDASVVHLSLAYEVLQDFTVEDRSSKRPCLEGILTLAFPSSRLVRDDAECVRRDLSWSEYFDSYDDR